jgi:hypothetical protein
MKDRTENLKTNDGTMEVFITRRTTRGSIPSSALGGLLVHKSGPWTPCFMYPLWMVRRQSMRASTL